MKKLLFLALLTLFCIPSAQARSLKKRVALLEKKVNIMLESEKNAWARIKKTYSKVLAMEKELPAIKKKQLRVIEVDEDGMCEN